MILIDIKNLVEENDVSVGITSTVLDSIKVKISDINYGNIDFIIRIKAFQRIFLISERNIKDVSFRINHLLLRRLCNTID